MKDLLQFMTSCLQFFSLFFPFFWMCKFERCLLWDKWRRWVTLQKEVWFLDLHSQSIRLYQAVSGPRLLTLTIDYNLNKDFSELKILYTRDQIESAYVFLRGTVNKKWNSFSELMAHNFWSWLSFSKGFSLKNWGSWKEAQLANIRGGLSRLFLETCVQVIRA